MFKRYIVLVALFCIAITAKTQVNIYTRADTLRGSMGDGRKKWDIIHYDITVKPDFNSKTIQGKNSMRFTDSGVFTMQVDLQEPMILDSITDEFKSYPIRREGNVYWVSVRDSNARYKIRIHNRTLTAHFHGKPREAVRAPWDGGWIWKTDNAGNPWMSVACQGLGASVWYPCKDTQADEPDSGAILRMIVPDSLTAIANGRLKEEKKAGPGLMQFSYEVKNPINNYNLVPYIGSYAHWNEQYMGLKGPLDMDYWVLSYNLDNARAQFKDAERMMKAFEYWFGPYPFYEDGYKLVEAPHLGMEHQSAIAYGNNFTNGYKGASVWSGTPWGMQFDFIIIHESGHEWFANNITSADMADMWVHESFTAYSETLFTDYYYGKEAGNEYVIGTRKNIQNKTPIIREYGVNADNDIDCYYKGANMIHTIRQVINNDKKFRKILVGLNKTFYHRIVGTKDIEAYISKKSGYDFSALFNQYLRTTQIPELQIRLRDGKLSYRWENTVPGFSLKLKILVDGKTYWITPGTEWQTFKGNKNKAVRDCKTDPNFYINVKQV